MTITANTSALGDILYISYLNNVYLLAYIYSGSIPKWVLISSAPREHTDSKLLSAINMLNTCPDGYAGMTPKEFIEMILENENEIF
jgi:hypothetical protein